MSWLILLRTLFVSRTALALNAATLAGRVEPRRDLSGDRDCFGQTNGVLGDSFPASVTPSTSSRTTTGTARGLFIETVSLPDLEVVERRQRLRFAYETRPATCITVLYGAKSLERCVTVQFPVKSTITFTHATNAERRARRGRRKYRA